jgi:pimeloyl-ACP methyl ester carboxylesterase
VNAFLRLERPREQLGRQRLHATMELRVGFQVATVEIGGRTVPLELESTSFLAYMLADSPIWERELKGFLLGDLTRADTRLVGLYPYRRGRIPVVLVHGTASSAGRWADLLNDLLNDPRIFRRYQFWFFSYDTGNPIAYSASLLRQSLTDAIERFDPAGEDPALRQMVLIGHSQGGLLVKMTVVETGDRLWNNVSNVPLDELASATCRSTSSTSRTRPARSSGARCSSSRCPTCVAWSSSPPPSAGASSPRKELPTGSRTSRSCRLASGA